MEQSERVKTLSSLMIAGGLKAPQKPRIRDEIWVKLWGNCSFNPVSADRRNAGCHRHRSRMPGAGPCHHD